jgi:hypothetical protein
MASNSLDKFSSDANSVIPGHFVRRGLTNSVEDRAERTGIWRF